jgi:hypothetical protein
MWSFAVYKPAVEELSPVLASLCGYVRESVEERQSSGTYNLTPTWRILAAQAAMVHKAPCRK